MSELDAVTGSYPFAPFLCACERDSLRCFWSAHNLEVFSKQYYAGGNYRIHDFFGKA